MRSWPANDKVAPSSRTSTGRCVPTSCSAGGCPGLAPSAQRDRRGARRQPQRRARSGHPPGQSRTSSRPPRSAGFSVRSLSLDAPPRPHVGAHPARDARTARSRSPRATSTGKPTSSPPTTASTVTPTHFEDGTGNLGMDDRPRRLPRRARRGCRQPHPRTAPPPALRRGRAVPHVVEHPAAPSHAGPRR